MGLDLSSLEGWTHELLEEVARKRGIRNPEFRRHAELVRLLLRQQYGERFQAGRERVARGVAVAGAVRQVMGKLVGTAFEQLVPQALGALLGRGEPRQSAERSMPARAQSLAPRAELGRAREQATPSPTSTRNFVELPRRTRSMARWLATQGHRERALAIYAELLAAAADADPTLRAEMQAIARGEAVQNNLARSSAVRAMRPPTGDDRLICELLPSSGLRLQWSVSDAGLRRGRAVLAEQGELAVRLLCIERDPVSVVRSAITEHGPIDAGGVWTAPALPAVAHCFVAVGLRAGDRFVAIVHANPKLETRPQ